MSHNENWDVNKYKEEHESDDQWELRKSFLVKWKDHYPEERLVCLAQVFANIEFMGCRYPIEVMREVARLSGDIAKQYRNNKKTKLQRTFVSASDAAEDRVRGVKREGGVIVESPDIKTRKIEFIPQRQSTDCGNSKEVDETGADTLLERIQPADSNTNIETQLEKPETNNKNNEKPSNGVTEVNGLPNYRRINYVEDLSKMPCLDSRDFKEWMFNTPYGRFVLVIRPWTDMLTNLRCTCNALKIPLIQDYSNGVFMVTLNNIVLARIPGDKVSAKARACKLIWRKLRRSTVVLVFKWQWVPQNDTRISIDDMSGKFEFGEPIEDSVALKMMQLMGWKGGGLGADNQGIAEPIKPNFRMVRRAGLGHETANSLTQLKRAGLSLMRRRAVTFDADLVFAADFSIEERAVLHQCASQCGLMSKSYGKGQDRFLVVTNKLKPLPLVRSVVECGGETVKYRVFVPASIGDANEEPEKKIMPTSCDTLL